MKHHLTAVRTVGSPTTDRNWHILMILSYLVIRSTTVDQLSIFVKTISKHFLKE
jgi:hypothetical protein